MEPNEIGNGIFPQRSRFITYLALFSIVAAVILIYEDISNLLLLNSLMNRPEYRIAEQLMPVEAASSTGTIFEIILQCFGIIASIGLFNRLNWGRVMYMAMLTAITLWGIVSSISSYLSITQYLKGYGMESSLSLMVIGNIIALGINVYLIFRLTRKEIKDEFGQ